MTVKQPIGPVHFWDPYVCEVVIQLLNINVKKISYSFTALFVNSSSFFSTMLLGGSSHLVSGL